MRESLIELPAGIADIVPAPRLAMLRIKHWGMDATAISTLLPQGLALPRTVCTGAALGEVSVWCLGPGDWLLIGQTKAPFAAAHAALKSMAGFAVVDLSDTFCSYRIAGTEARTLLSKGCGLDFDSRRFAVGGGARTRFANIPLIVCRVGADAFEVHVGRSYCDYLYSWLLDARWDLPGDE